jgi:type VI secretion system secreted protein VgrG
MGNGYNELSFEDAMGMERVFLRAERNLEELVQNDHDVSVQRNERISVGVNRFESVGLDQQLDVGRNYTLRTSGRGTEWTGGDHLRTVGGTATERVSHDYRLEVGGVFVAEAPQGHVLASAGQSILLMQGDDNLLRMTDEDSKDNGLPGKGLTLVSDTARVHLTTDQVDVSVEGSNIQVKPDRIELTVGASSLVITPAMIQVNGKTFPPVGGSAPGNAPGSDP